MSLPPNFSAVEHLQDGIRKTVNKEVIEWFRDVKDDNLETPRGTLKRMCTHMEDDTADVTQMKIIFFYMVCGAMPGMKGWLAPERAVMSVEGQPQVILNFVETEQSVKARKVKKRHTMRCSFRLMTEQFESTSDKAKIERLEMLIKQQFPLSYKHQCGQTNFTYIDKPKGFQLRIAAFTESDAKTLAKKLIQCSIDGGVTFEEQHWSKASTKGKATGATKRVLGKPIKLNEKRPSAIVTLRQADLFIPGWGSQTLVYRLLN